MGLRQQFSTMVYSWDGALSAEVLFLPSRDLLESQEDAHSVLSFLGASLLSPFRHRDAARALGTFLAAVEAGGSVLQRWQQEVKEGRVESFAPSDDHLRFAEELLESSRIPFEESPLTGVPLGQLIAQASPTGLGALVGWVAAAGSTPLLFIYVPAGIIIVRCAVGVGRGLEEALHARIKRLFTRRS